MFGEITQTFYITDAYSTFYQSVPTLCKSEFTVVLRKTAKETLNNE